MSIQALELEWAWVEGTWQRNVWVTIDREGRFDAILGAEATRPPRIEPTRVRGMALPGMVNVHSHAFQRGMAGAAEYRTADHDSFWTWRRLMYHFVDQLTPDDMFVLARQTYLELLRGGYTSVGEFHYVHNDRDGRPYRAATEMSDAILAAAADAGIRLCLLPALYQQAGFGGRPLETQGQQRFALSVDEWLAQIESLSAATDARTDVSVAAALHSLRAVDIAAARRALEGLEQIDYRGPLHMHVSEQQREVDECLAHCGRRPVELALDELNCDGRWTFIHATHANAEELRRLALARVLVGLCPSTEANLGDGIFPTADWQRLGGQLAIGSDSHIGLQGVAELRLLEYVQRLRLQQRIVLQGMEPREAEPSCGTWLYQCGLQGGARSLQLPLGEFAPGSFADFVVLEREHPTLCGLPSERWLDAFVFADTGDLVQQVWVGGKRRIADRGHAQDSEARAAFQAVRERILANWTG